MYYNFLAELKKQRLINGYSIASLSKETRISKKIINKIEELSESEVASFPQKHLLFLYAKHLGVRIPGNEINSIHTTNKQDFKLLNDITTTNFFSSLINNFKFQITFPLFIVVVILVFNYSLKNNSSAELTFDNIEIISQNKPEIDLSKNSYVSNQHVNTDIFSPFSDNSIQSTSVSRNEENFIRETVVLSLTFDNEVWIEIENSMETIISQVFTEGDQLNLEVLKEDEIFITSGNMGLISIKVDDNQKQFLGSMGEIGRKRIF